MKSLKVSFLRLKVSFLRLKVSFLRLKVSFLRSYPQAEILLKVTLLRLKVRLNLTLLFIKSKMILITYRNRKPLTFESNF